MDATTGEKSFIGVETKIFGDVEIETWPCDKVTDRLPVLLIHGMFGGGWYFEDWARFLGGKSFPVYVIKDLHEGEDLNKVDFYTYVKKSTQVAERINGITAKKIIILGHSMGGLIAQKIAETNPELVEGIILVTSAPPKGISSMSWNVANAMFKHIPSLVFNLPLKIDKKSALELIFNWLGGEEKKEYFLKKLVPESSRVAKQLAFSQISIDEKKVNCKSLVVVGRYDKLLPLKVQVGIAEKYDSDYTLFLSGHMPMLEYGQEEIIRGILHWIDKNLTH